MTNLMSVSSPTLRRHLVVLRTEVRNKDVLRATSVRHKGQIVVAAVKQGARLAGFQSGTRQSVDERRGFQVVAVFATLLVAFATVQGAMLVGVAIAALLVVGSALVAAGGEPLAVRSATVMGTIHVAAVALLTLA